jgi:hypothetical protein
LIGLAHTVKGTNNKSSSFFIFLPNKLYLL